MLDRFPRLARFIERLRYIKKAVVATVGAGAAGAGMTLAEPEVTGLPLWANALIAAVLAFITVYFPANGPKPQ